MNPVKADSDNFMQIFVDVDQPWVYNFTPVSTAPVHLSIMTRLSRGFEMPNLPYSLDLAPPDYYIFPNFRSDDWPLRIYMKSPKCINRPSRNSMQLMQC